MTTVKAYAKIVGPGWVHYMERPSCVMGRGPSSCDVVLTGDASISREHVKIDFSPEQQAFEIAVVGKNGIFVNGDFLRRGERPRRLRSHTDIIVGRATPMLVTFYLPKKDARPADADSDTAPADGPAMLTVVGQQLVAADRPLDAEQLYDAVSAARLRICDRLASPMVIRASIRAAITMNPHIFRTIPALDRHLDEQRRTGSTITPSSSIPAHTLAAFEVREEHRLRFLTKPPTAAHAPASAPNGVRPAPNGTAVR